MTRLNWTPVLDTTGHVQWQRIGRTGHWTGLVSPVRPVVRADQVFALENLVSARHNPSCELAKLIDATVLGGA